MLRSAVQQTAAAAAFSFASVAMRYCQRLWLDSSPSSFVISSSSDSSGGLAGLRGGPGVERHFQFLAAACRRDCSVVSARAAVGGLPDRASTCAARDEARRTRTALQPAAVVARRQAARAAASAVVCGGGGALSAGGRRQRGAGRPAGRAPAARGRLRTGRPWRRRQAPAARGLAAAALRARHRRSAPAGAAGRA